MLQLFLFASHGGFLFATPKNSLKDGLRSEIKQASNPEVLSLTCECSPSPLLPITLTRGWPCLGEDKTGDRHDIKVSADILLTSFTLRVVFPLSSPEPLSSLSRESPVCNIS